VLNAIVTSAGTKSRREKVSGTVVRSTLRAIPATVPDTFSQRLEK
jgi:hypothetical protein